MWWNSTRARQRCEHLWARVNKSEEEATHGLPTFNANGGSDPNVSTWSLFRSNKTDKKKQSVVITGPHPPRRDSDASDPSNKSLPPTPPPRSERHWFRIWWLEILGILFSLGCTAAIIGVLRTIDGRPLNTWRLVGIADQLTPNALVSILSTLAKISLLFSVAEGLGQLKWCYFEQRPRQLNDIQIFDDATRGPMGALTLLFKLHFHADAALLGALVVIMSLAVDVVVQQVLTFPTQATVAQNMTASVRYAKGYSANIVVQSAISPEPAYNDMASSFSRGIYGFNPADTLDVHCASGNCTWEPFETLGICNTCEDISDQTQIACAYRDNVLKDYGNGLKGLVGRDNLNKTKAETCNYTAPNGRQSSVNWARINGYVNPRWSTINTNSSVDFASYVDYQNRSAFVPANGEILNYTSIAIDNNQTAWQVGIESFAKIKPKAYSCQWKWCAQRYTQLRYRNGSVGGLNYIEQPLKWECTTDGVLMTNCIGVHADADWPTEYKSYNMPNTTVSGNLGGIINANNVYVLNVYGMGLLQSYINERIDGKIANGSGSQNPRYNDLRAFSLANNGVVPVTMASMVASFNKMLRERDGESFVAPGKEWMDVTLVAVNWPLLVYPAALPLLGAMFLIATIIHSRNTSPWKSSTLGFLYHGLDKQCDMSTPGMDQNYKMDKMAKATHVQLRSAEGRKQLIQAGRT